MRTEDGSDRVAGPGHLCSSSVQSICEPFVAPWLFEK